MKHMRPSQVHKRKLPNVYNHQLLEAYAAGNLERAMGLIHIYRDRIDIDYVMDYAIWPHCQPWDSKLILDRKLADDPAKNAVLEYVLEQFKDSIDPNLISFIFSELCEKEHCLTFFFIELFTDVLTAEIVSEALSIWASQEFRFELATRCTDKINPELFKDLVYECYNIDLLERLVDAYPDRMKTPCFYMGLRWYHDSKHHIYADTELIQLLLKECGDDTYNFLFHQAVRAAELETARLLLDHKPELLLDRASEALHTACITEDLDMMDLILDTIGPNLMPSSYISAFNSSCEQGKNIAVELLLARCAEHLQFEQGFTFEWAKVLQHADVRELLEGAYGSWLSRFFTIRL